MSPLCSKPISGSQFHWKRDLKTFIRAAKAPYGLAPSCFFDPISCYFWTHSSFHSSHTTPFLLLADTGKPPTQGRGAGSRLLRCTISKHSHDSMPIYLCSNVSLLMRFNPLASLPSDSPFFFFHSHLIPSQIQYT